MDEMGRIKDIRTNVMDFGPKKKKEDFTALRRKHIFLCLVPDAPVLPSLCVSALPPSLPLSFLLFYLRSLSEGLTISSSVSPLSCSAVYCL